VRVRLGNGLEAQGTVAELRAAGLLPDAAGHAPPGCARVVGPAGERYDVAVPADGATAAWVAQVCLDLGAPSGTYVLLNAAREVGYAAGAGIRAGAVLRLVPVLRR
jgi:hypothetical protein